MAWGIKKKGVGFVANDGSVPPQPPVSSPTTGNKSMADTGHGSFAPLYSESEAYPFSNRGAAQVYAENHAISEFDIVDGGSKSDVVTDPAAGSSMPFKEAERRGKAAAAPRRAPGYGDAQAAPVVGATRAGSTVDTNANPQMEADLEAANANVNAPKASSARVAQESRRDTKATRDAKAAKSRGRR